ncbi:MAG: polyprenol monophosphomannose synthase [Chloroflexi bacterium]|nr:polyprenol monophosphomannose synthase [Chloroflexota bacterium]
MCPTDTSGLTAGAPTRGGPVVVLPTYNEGATLPVVVEALRRLAVPGLRMLVIDDNSPDGTGRVAEGLAGRYPDQVWVHHRPAKMGLASAYLCGFRLALGAGATAIVEMDSDLSHPPAMVPQLLDALVRNDVAVGSRYVQGGGAEPGWAWHRRLLSRSGNLYARWALGLPVSDVTSGFKAFRREVLTSLDLDRVRSQGFSFQVEMAYACHRQGFRVVELPILFAERRAGHSKMSLSVVGEALWRVWQIRARY